MKLSMGMITHHDQSVQHMLFHGCNHSIKGRCGCALLHHLVFLLLGFKHISKYEGLQRNVVIMRKDNIWAPIIEK